MGVFCWGCFDCGVGCTVYQGGIFGDFLRIIVIAIIGMEH
jgi:hypothetical protein